MIASMDFYWFRYQTRSFDDIRISSVSVKETFSRIKR